MTDQLEIRGPNGERLLAPVHEGSFVVGSDAAADVRLLWPGIGPAHFRFVRTAAGVRVEPVRPGGTVSVNGEELFCKDLGAGDVIEVAGVRLRWLPEPTAPAVAPGRAAATGSAAAPRPAPGRVAASRKSPEAAARPARARRARGLPAIVPVALLVALACVVGLLLYRHFSASTWPNSTQHYVALARAQLSNHQMQRALATLAFALREATGATRAEAVQLEADIRRLMLESAEMPKVMTARQEHDLLLEYVGRYLRDAVQRPAAREFVRVCDQWLQRHREVCARVTDGQPLLRAVEDQRSRWVAMAALGEPDTAEDVVFAAGTRLRFQWRDYRSAIARLDAYLAAHPGDATVTAARATMITEGAEWLRGKLRNIDFLLGRGDTDNAEKDLAQLERWSVLPEWAPLVAERRQRLGAGR